MPDPVSFEGCDAESADLRAASLGELRSDEEWRSLRGLKTRPARVELSVQPEVMFCRRWCRFCAFALIRRLNPEPVLPLMLPLLDSCRDSCDRLEGGGSLWSCKVVEDWFCGTTLLGSSLVLDAVGFWSWEKGEVCSDLESGIL